jgi:hypothetical protein
MQRPSEPGEFPWVESEATEVTVLPPDEGIGNNEEEEIRRSTIRESVEFQGDGFPLILCARDPDESEEDEDLDYLYDDEDDDEDDDLDDDLEDLDDDEEEFEEEDEEL